FVNRFRAAELSAPDEIGVAVGHFKAELAQLDSEPSARCEDLRSRLLQIFLVLNRRGCGEQAQGVAVIRVLDLDQLAHQRRVGDGISPPSGTNVLVRIVNTSSDPLPIRIASGSTSSTRPAACRNAAPVGSGYLRSRSPVSPSRSASMTRGDGGYGFSLVLSLINERSRGCSPGT